jgi:hypothetical protein
MPTGRALDYTTYDWEDLRAGATLAPPAEAHRAYLLAEGGLVRYIVGDEKPSSSVGMPLIPDFPEEFDCDLDRINVHAGAQDVRLHVYYYRSA